MASPRYVTLRTFETAAEAHLSRNRLLAEGIDCYVEEENMPGSRRHRSVIDHAAKLLVLERRVAKAQKILARPATPVQKPQASDCCPDCGTPDRKRLGILRLVVVLLGFLLGLVPGRRNRVWVQCPDCGRIWKRAPGATGPNSG